MQSQAPQLNLQDDLKSGLARNYRCKQRYQQKASVTAKVLSPAGLCMSIKDCVPGENKETVICFCVHHWLSKVVSQTQQYVRKPITTLKAFQAYV